MDRSGLEMPARAAVLSAPLVFLSACNKGVLDPKGPVGAAQKLILSDATLVMLAVVVPVIVATLLVAWWFREGNERAKRRPDWSYSGPIELVVWSIPVLVVGFLGGIAWIGSHRLDPPRPLVSDKDPLSVEVVSLDWKWLFVYPAEGIASVNRLVIPAGRPVSFRLTSGSVMNSFFVPQLGSQIYTMWGMATRLHLQADAPGTFKGLSAHFSGDGFSDMHFVVDALPDEGFSGWVAKAKAAGGALNAEVYRELARPGGAAAPRTFGAVPDGFFDALMAGSLEPGAGSRTAPEPMRHAMSGEMR